ncbi:chromophore lyase CRL, chloroplastic-like isoform X3 [Mangifera indica]|uniref:chromophore lyase CRL, chloroplastic-like isoform X3 n=1 Tax=Mangifera indica TaxID=29780 RepID=UPI001CFA603E|nr:chromophore lyase CRL, chloroplastic-like isoform X3 [Mangifera indica]
MGTASESDSDSNANGWGRARGLMVKTVVLIGSAVLLKRLTKSETRWDHARNVAASLTGEKASRDPDNYFNIRMVTCPAAEMVDGSKVLYFEQAFWRTPQKPFRQVNSFALREVEEYKNFCDRSKDQRPLPEEVIGDIGEHLTTIYLRCCDRGNHCLYEGSSPPGGFPNSWNGATHCTSELAVLKNNEIHTWDRGYDDDGNQVWGVKESPYEFKPSPNASFNEMFSLNFPPLLSMEKKIEGSFVLQE